MAGDTVVWDDPPLTDPARGTFSAADGWTLTYELVAAAARATVTAVVDGTAWRTTLDSTTTAALKADPDDDANAEQVRWVATVSKGAERYTVLSGLLTLFPDASTLDAFVSETAKALKRVRTVIAALETGGIASYAVQGRQLTKLDLPMLYKREAQLAFALSQENSGEFGRAIEVHFQRAQ